MDEIGGIEWVSPKRSLGLEQYMLVTGLKPTMLANKTIVNLAAGGSNIEADLRQAEITPARVLNIDIKYEQPSTKNYTADELDEGLYIGGDMAHTPLPSEIADYIFAVGGMLWAEPRRQVQMLKEIERILKKGGKAYIHPAGTLIVKDKKISFSEFAERHLSQAVATRSFKPSYPRSYSKLLKDELTFEIAKIK